MRTARSTIGRWLLLPLIALVLVASSPSLALAQRKGLNDKLLEEDTSKSYALPYALVVLGVALGVMIIERPSTRADEPKRRTEENENENE